MSEKLEELASCQEKDKSWEISDKEIREYNKIEQEPIDKSWNEKLAASFKIYF